MMLKKLNITMLIGKIAKSKNLVMNNEEAVKILSDVEVQLSIGVGGLWKLSESKSMLMNKLLALKKQIGIIRDKMSSMEVYKEQYKAPFNYIFKDLDEIMERI